MIACINAPIINCYTMKSDPTNYCPSDVDIVRLSAVQCIAKRPAMFTSTGSIGEVFSLFRDYDPSHDGGATLDVVALRDAARWIGSECGFEPFRSDLDDIVAKIKKRFGGRDDFFSALVANFPPE